MTDTEDSTPTTLDRVPTGIPGLDAITRGGFLRGGIYMILARPGAGKTILGNQICFRHVAAGGRALVVTLLTESHSRMLAQLQTLAFFDPTCVGSALSYVAGYDALEKDGLKGLLVLLRQMVRDHKATFLMLDGLVTAGSMAASEVETKKFIHELQVFVELVGCTTVLLTGEDGASRHYALQTMVDGLVELRFEPLGVEAVRSIAVTKLRGSDILVGLHRFDISDAGITIYPRTESFRGRSIDRPDPTLARMAELGIDGLDAMLGGGLRQGSITTVLGASGTGKTLLGLSFLAAAARAGEPSLYFGFFETPADLCRKADAIGLRLSEHVNSGFVEMMWQSPLDGIADALAEKLFAAVHERKVKRVFIDGLGGFKDTLVYPERSRRFFDALYSQLRSLGVATVLSDEALTPSDPEVPERGVAPMIDNIVSVRRVELRSQLRKLITVTKMREGAGDPSVHEFSIGPRGLVVSAASESAEATLGTPRGGRKSSRGPAKKDGKKRRKRRVE